MKKAAYIIVFVFVFCQQIVAQETETEDHQQKIRGAIMMANSHVPAATSEGTQVVVIPAWGIDIDYFFHRHWSAALQGDIKIQSFEIEEEGAIVKRTNPITLAAVIHYHTFKNWSFYTGPGIELEPHKNYFLIKVGTEYSFEVSENFEIALNLAYENKQDVYDAWTFGIAFNKKLWGK